MAALVLAGEAVFALPFHVTRFFRPTVLESFQLSNTELGTAQAVYGVVAMLAYFAGGPLADRYPARALLTLSLLSTAAGGLYMATLPGFQGAMFLWGFFGLTTILLFWAALIRATREWGGHDEQGRAYGLLDAGRGVLAAVLASAGAALFASVFPAEYANTSLADRQQALRVVILGYTAVTAACGAFVWFALKGPSSGPTPSGHHARFTRDLAEVLRLPSVWMTAVIVVCAYVGYKGFDNYSLYAVQAFGLTEVEAAGISASGAWVRPIAALTIGMLGDRYSVSRMTVICFAALLATQLLFAVHVPQDETTWILLGNILVGSAAMFGLRALYFALLEATSVPMALTGTAIGIISVIGFTPDIFVNYFGGVLLDSAPGLPGHQRYFGFIASFAALGLLTSWILHRRLSRSA